MIGNPNGPNNLSAGDRVIDGEHGATIKCSVKGGGPATFSGKIDGVSNSDGVTLTITDGNITADKKTGTATIAVNTTQVTGNLRSDPGACTVSVVGDNVKPGSLWATVYCARIFDSSTPGSACSVGTTTTFVLENCDS